MIKVTDGVLEWDDELAQYLAQCIYHGLNVTEFCSILGIPSAECVYRNHQYANIWLAAKAKAKLDLMKKQLEIAKNVEHRDCMKAGQWLLASRFAMTEQKAEIRSKMKQCEMILEQKERVRRDVSDFKATVLAQNASSNQIKEWIEDAEKASSE